MSFVRHMEPEWLDELPASDPRAARSRRDLKLINVLMLQKRAMTRLMLRACVSPPRTLVELGGGDGTFLLGVARALAPNWRGVTVTLVDRQDIVAPKTHDAFRALGWELRVARADIFDFLENPAAKTADIVSANLFLHHLTDAELTRMFAGVSRMARAFAAAEPRRSVPALTASKLLFAVGANDVTRHDAVASVRAGFSGKELSRLWPSQSGWRLAESAVPPFTHGFAAWRPD